MNVKLAKLCAYVLLSCFALFVIEIVAINHGAKHLLGITNPSQSSKTSATLRREGLNQWQMTHQKALKEKKKITPSVYQGFFKQKQNHFDYTDSTTWPHRYYVSYEHWNKDPDSLVIFLLGGLHELTYSDFQTGVWDEMAKETKALLVCLEHRYHGLSEPTRDLSLDNLLYLNSEQALADAAYFIKKVRNAEVEFLKNVDKIKWIAVGASHGGALAAKLKLKFPHLLAGAVAVDAPLLATKKFTEYYEAIIAELNTNLFAKNTVLVAYEIIQEAVIYGTAKQLGLKGNFNLCDTKHNDYTKKDMQLFLWSISTLLEFTMQSERLNSQSIKSQIMKILGNESNENTLEKFGEAIRKILKEKSISCLNINYGDAVTSYRNENWNSPINDLLYFGLGNRQDLFQSCTQFGQFEVYDKYEYVPIEFYGDFCKDVFGSLYGSYSLQQGVMRSNMFYGGLDIEVEDVYFVSHSLDYFMGLGIVDNVPKNSDAVCINDPFYLSTEYTDQETSTRNYEWDIIISKLKQWNLSTNSDWNY